ncbi:putative TetR family transcriptional regulator [Gordonia hirsuta DSM 44140 = NBRC 16056]|uniref:Putative TetR family transcriptional regulator n=1 Tax=Gordonia hirsuta DSM 44140 = NBRC 16056 TaxID=1121927 RepID=L7L785_9ACTN|nr:TetR/AcrR family transcriptional regulator [Gordonia hirsuta]GAC55888.1 putative TetR family transcriptional regulator [Gordonia hirsuta DSM 44140 = NBRC 16056]
MTTPRARRRQELDREILRLGRAQLADVGAASLSVRAIARELGLASSAVYRYVASRDELLTRLVVAAYDDLADQVAAAVTANPGPPAAELRTALQAFRAWALAHSAEFSLLYGSPVPDYHAPPERTSAPGTRVIGQLLGLLGEAFTAHPTAPSRVNPSPPARLQHELQSTAEEFGAALDDAGMVAAISLWCWLIGAVGQEVTGGFGPETFDDPAALFDMQLQHQLAVLNLQQF